MSRPIITDWPDKWVAGAKRAQLDLTLPSGTLDLFTGRGKCEGCYLEGTWWDMVCLARNILASKNTQLACPEYYRPDLKIDHYIGGEPYEYKVPETEEEKE